MRNSKKYIIIGLSFMLLWRCTERIDVGIGTTYTRLVIEGYITTDTMSHKIKLTKTSDYFSNQPSPPVSGAMVRLYDGNILIELSESSDYPGVYLTQPDFYGIPGKIYTLMINQVDIDKDGTFEEYTANSSLKPVNSIDSIKLELIEGKYYKFYELRVYAWDPPTKDFYAFKVLKNGILLTDSLSELIVQNDVFFNGNYTYGIPCQFLDQDKEEEILYPGDTVTFEINGITEDYYNFITEAQSEIFYQTPIFSGPPANIKSNLSGSAVGFFTAYSVNRCSIVFKGEE